MLPNIAATLNVVYYRCNDMNPKILFIQGVEHKMIQLHQLTSDTAVKAFEAYLRRCNLSFHISIFKVLKRGLNLLST